MNRFVIVLSCFLYNCVFWAPYFPRSSLLGCVFFLLPCFLVHDYLCVMIEPICCYFSLAFRFDAPESYLLNPATAFQLFCNYFAVFSPCLLWCQQGSSIVGLVSYRPGSTWLIRTPSQLEPYHEAADVCLCRFNLAIFDNIFKHPTCFKLFQERLKKVRDPKPSSNAVFMSLLHSIFNNLQKLRFLVRQLMPPPAKAEILRLTMPSGLTRPSTFGAGGFAFRS